MKLIQNTFFLLILVSGIAFSSCKKEDSCTPPDVTENIVGTWDLRLSAGAVEFKADGTLLDPSDALYGVEINGVVYDQKSYSISGSTLTITAMPSAGNGSSSIDFEITGNKCDEIKIEVLGFTETMVRK
jgi:hypothetical protein